MDQAAPAQGELAERAAVAVQVCLAEVFAEFGELVDVIGAARTRLARFRVGDDVLLVDAEGNSYIAGEDYATAFVDELEKPTHHRTVFTVAY